MPENGKSCNFDCIYCECGWNRDGREDRKLPSADEVRSALESRLAECLRDNIHIDSITFAGDGEPTLNPDFPEIVEDTLELRDKYFPSAKVSVLSNSTTIGNDRIFKALRRVDNPIMKIDAPTTELARRINNPAGNYDVRKIVEKLKGFEGDFILQTMFLKSPGFDSSDPEVLAGWMDIVRLLNPRQIMVYTIDRPTPATDLERFSETEMRRLVEPLATEGYNIQIKG